VTLVFRRDDRQPLGIHNVGDIAGELIYCRVLVQVRASGGGKLALMNRSIVPPVCISDSPRQGIAPFEPRHGMASSVASAECRLPWILVVEQLELCPVITRPARPRRAWSSGLLPTPEGTRG
jgi:hypothetical protein